METATANPVATGSKTKWVSDPTHSELSFKVKHLMITNVKGEFRKFTAEMEGNDFTTSKIKVTIDPSSIYTNDDSRDGHLKNADFFDVEKHKEILFDGTSFKKLDQENYQLKGLLTMKGISKEVILDVEYAGITKDPWGNEKAGFSLQGKINRLDWGLNFNATLETGGLLLSNEIKISAEIQFVKQS